MARLRTRVERAAVLHRQAAAAAAATAAAVAAYSPASAPAEQYAEQHDLAARLRAAAADLVPGWLGASLDAVPAATPLGDIAVPAHVRLGLAHPLDDARFPAVVPLLGTGHLAVDADARDPRVAGLLRSILLRMIAAATPGTLRIRVIDAAGAGDTITAFSGIPDVLPPPVTDHTGLQMALAEADGWVREPGPPHCYKLLVVASMPELTDGTDLTRVAHLARIGVPRRLHLIVAGWPPPPLTAETTQPPLPQSTQVSLRNPYVWMGDPPGATYSGTGVGPSRLNSPVYLDPDPPVALIQRVCAELAAVTIPAAEAEIRAWTPPVQRWGEYIAAAQRLDAVRREAAKVVTEQTANLKRARAELSTVRRQLSSQQARIGDILRDGRPVPLEPGPAERGAADAALGRLAQAASARAAAARTQSGPLESGPIGKTAGFAIAAPTTGSYPAATPTTGPLRPHSGPGRGSPTGGPPAVWAGPRPGPGTQRPDARHAPAPIQVTSPPGPGAPMPHVPVSGPGGRPPGLPVSGGPHPAYVSTGSFPVVSAPPHPGLGMPVSGPPAPAPLTGPPSASPRLPEAALAMLGEARAALARADLELSDVDARVNSSPGWRNAPIYAAYALLFALIQLPLLASLAASENAVAVAAAPCGLFFVLVSFGMAWLTIGAVHRQPGGQRPPRTPFLGVLFSLLAATPGFFTLVWMVADTAG